MRITPCWRVKINKSPFVYFTTDALEQKMTHFKLHQWCEMVYTSSLRIQRGRLCSGWMETQAAIAKRHQPAHSGLCSWYEKWQDLIFGHLFHTCLHPLEKKRQISSCYCSLLLSSGSLISEPSLVQLSTNRTHNAEHTTQNTQCNHPLGCAGNVVNQSSNSSVNVNT